MKKKNNNNTEMNTFCQKLTLDFIGLTLENNHFGFHFNLFFFFFF